jgi:hypothetical protein
MKKTAALDRSSNRERGPQLTPRAGKHGTCAPRIAADERHREFHAPEAREAAQQRQWTKRR